MCIRDREDCRCAVVTVSSGDGIKDIFLELGAACIINGDVYKRQAYGLDPDAEENKDMLGMMEQQAYDTVVSAAVIRAASERCV